MDVHPIATSVFDIPSARRVGVIAHDGAADLRLWPGPGPDRDLASAWGSGLQGALDAQRGALGVDALELGQVTRVLPGKLRCDFLAWVATRPSEPGASRAPAPSLELLERAVTEVLVFAAARSVSRVAFPALGAGPSEADAAARLAAIVRAATRYQEDCFAQGRPTIVQEVVVCEASPAVMRAARRLSPRLSAAADPSPAPEPASAPSRSASKPRASATRKSSAGSRAATGRGAKRGAKRGAPRLDPTEVAQLRAASDPYDRTRSYAAGQGFLHSKFGVGRVERVTAEGAIEVLFEDGTQRKLVHGQA